MEPALFTLDKDGYPLLDGRRIPCITSFELEAPDPGLVHLTMRIAVRLDPKYHLTDAGEEVQE